MNGQHKVPGSPPPFARNDAVYIAYGELWDLQSEAARTHDLWQEVRKLRAELITAKEDLSRPRVLAWEKQLP